MASHLSDAMPFTCQWQFVVNETLGNKIKWNLKQYTNILIQENECENVWKNINHSI